MQQTRLLDYFSRRGETRVEREIAVQSNARGIEPTSDASICTPGRRSKRRLAACKVWKDLYVITYNTGSLSELRTHQIVSELEKKQVSVAFLQGTRNSFTGERLIGNYKLFYEDQEPVM